MANTFQYSSGFGLWIPDVAQADGTQYVNVYNVASNVGIRNLAPRVALDVTGTIAASSNVTVSESVFAKAVVLNDQRFSDVDLAWSSNTARWGSNTAASASNAAAACLPLAGGTLTGPLTGTTINATTLQQGGSNLAALYFPLAASNALFVQVAAASNTAVAASNTAVAASNTAYAALPRAGGTLTGTLTGTTINATTLQQGGSNLANLFYPLAGSNALHTGLDFSSNASAWASNAGAFGSNAASGALARAGGTVTGALTVNGLTTLAGGAQIASQLTLSGFGSTIRGAANALTIESEHELRLAADWNSNNGGAPITFGWGTASNSTFTELARFDATGRLGLGTTAPVERLHVEGNAWASGQFLANSNDSPGAPAYSFRQDANTGMFHIAENTLGFATAAVERARIDDQGRLGVGTTAPTDRLHVAGGMLRADGVGWGTGINFNGSDNRIMSHDTSSSLMLHVGTGSNFVVWHAGSLPRFHISSNGNVGIATTTPSERLHVAGNVYSTAQYLANDAVDSAVAPTFSFVGDSNTGVFHAAADALGVTTGGVERLRVNAAGQLGLGTTAPAHLLDVAGTGRFAGQLNVASTARFSSNTFVDAATTQFALTDAASQLTLGSGSNAWQNAALVAVAGRSRAVTGGYLGLSACDNGFISFSSHNAGGTGTEWARIDASGRLGIGTTAPAHALDVVGTGRFSSIVVSSNVQTRAWSVGPTLTLNAGWMDLTTGANTYTLNLEGGNPGAGGGSMFDGGFLNGTDGSGDSLSWNAARLILRGCRTGTGVTPSTLTADVRVYNSNAGWTAAVQRDGVTAATMTLSDRGTANGYCTNVSPYFRLLPAQMSAPVLGLRISTPAGVTYRLGPTYLSLVS